jgi:transposase
MRQKSGTGNSPSERLVKDLRRATRKHYSAEEKIRIVLDGLRGESSIAELCRREGIAEGLYYSWSEEFLEAGKRRLAGNTARAATSIRLVEQSHLPVRRTLDKLGIRPGTFYRW